MPKDDLLTATKLLDEIIVLFELYGEDYNVIDAAFRHIAHVKKAHPTFPVSVRIANILQERGLLNGNLQ